MIRPFALATVLGTSLPAFTQELINGNDPSLILEVANSLGSAELDVDYVGDPTIAGDINGRRYAIYFYGCTDNANCTSIQFWSVFLKSEESTIERVNAWNEKHRYAKAVIDKDGYVSIYHDVNLFGGVSPANLADIFETYGNAMEKARDFF